MNNKFLSARELKIQEWERDALIWTLENVLENRKTVSIDESEEIIGEGVFLDDLDNLGPRTPVFVMANAEEILPEYECGSAGCIGGWMMMHKLGMGIGDKLDHDTGRVVHKYVLADEWEGGRQHSDALHALFFGTTRHGDEVNLSDVTAKAAGKVVRRFLETGYSYWKEEDLED